MPEDEIIVAIPERVAPNRLSSDVASPYYDAKAIKDLIVTFNGVIRKNIVEYSVTGKWATMYLTDGRGNPKRERGKMSTITLHGIVKAYYP